MSLDINRAKHSVLISGDDYTLDDVDKLLKKGCKVYIFDNSDKINFLKESHNDFIKGFYLLLYKNPFNITVQIYDGESLETNRDTLLELEKGDANFNARQYFVEHTPISRDLIVEAGAGSGKTFAMVDRILFLMHTDSSFSFPKVAMITFTNKATDEMRHRLSNKLNEKYKLTKNPYYLKRIEEFSEISISTIHSFFKKVISETGSLLGYGSDLKLRSYVKEKRDLLRDLLNEQYTKTNHRVIDVIGLPVHEIEKLALSYWDKLDNLGLSEEEIANLDWGENEEGKATTIQDTLIEIFEEVDKRYFEKTFMGNSISMQDITHELFKAINNKSLKEFISKKYNYLFVDEFQDTDNAQIKIIYALKNIYDANLFVVGDIKQSIYRFRGATDSAFKRLKALYSKDELLKLNEEFLVKNYRTSDNVMTPMDDVFKKWGQIGLLEYKEALIAMSEKDGLYEQIAIYDNGERKDILLEIINELYKVEDNEQIVCLTRKNSELRKIKEWCEEAKLVCLIKERGRFYQCDAVLDFCSFVEALYYSEKPMYLYNYLKSSYADSIFDDSNLVEISQDEKEAYNILTKYINMEFWNTLKKNLNEKPVLSVLRQAIEDINPVRNYAINKKKELLLNGYKENDANEQSYIDSKQYFADLNKLLLILVEQFDGDFSSLGDICEFIRLKVLTDNVEELADAGDFNDCKCVQGYTVHSAKGLEFDNVILPFMNNKFYTSFRSEILVSNDRTSVGWVYRNNKEPETKNENYNNMLSEEKNETAKEETRLLYVAMTRAKKRLYCIPLREGHRIQIPSKWSELLPEEKDDEEGIRL